MIPPHPANPEKQEKEKRQKRKTGKREKTENMTASSGTIDRRVTNERYPEKTMTLSSLKRSKR